MNSAYIGIVLFYGYCFFRPEDFVSVLAAIPMAKIAAAISIVGIAGPIIAGNVRFTPEVKLLCGLYMYMVICIPGSIWVGGSRDLVINNFMKVVLISIASMWAITTLNRLNILVYMQIASILMLVILAQGQGLHAGRMFGVGNALGDPNDLALALCIILPFCLCFLLQSRSWFWKIAWIGALLLILLSIISTSSRGGFLALVAIIFAINRQFKISKKTKLSVLALLVCICAISVAVVGPSTYYNRLRSITDPEEDKTGSAQARQELLIKSIQTTFEHPVFGIGPGTFVIVSGSWHDTHNTYTQLSSETGIPGLAVFVMLIIQSFRNLKMSRAFRERTPVWYLAGAVHCSIVGYLVGAFFLSTAYALTGYVLFVYASALRSITADLKLNSLKATREVTKLKDSLNIGGANHEWAS
jgi:O-antigen ligase